jgi:hypothetical protein
MNKTIIKNNLIEEIICYKKAFFLDIENCTFKINNTLVKFEWFQYNEICYSINGGYCFLNTKENKRNFLSKISLLDLQFILLKIKSSL